MLEIDVDRADEILAVEECAHGDFHSDHPALKLKDFNFIGEGPLVGFEHSNYVLPILFLAYKQPALYVLRFAAGLNDVAPGILCHVLDRIVERFKLGVGDDVHTGFLQLLLAERAVVFEFVTVRGAADHGFAFFAQRLGFLALA